MHRFDKIFLSSTSPYWSPGFRLQVFKYIWQYVKFSSKAFWNFWRDDFWPLNAQSSNQLYLAVTLVKVTSHYNWSVCSAARVSMFEQWLMPVLSIQALALLMQSQYPVHPHMCTHLIPPQGGKLQDIGTQVLHWISSNSTFKCCFCFYSTYIMVSYRIQ